MAADITQLPAAPAHQVCAMCPLQQLIPELLERIAELEKRNAELEARLARYENAHTPPSLQEKRQTKPGSNPPGRPKGYKGSTRPTPEPDRIIGVTLEECPSCHSPLGEPVQVESRIIEEIPEPQPITVTEFRLSPLRLPHLR